MLAQILPARILTRDVHAPGDREFNSRRYKAMYPWHVAHQDAAADDGLQLRTRYGTVVYLTQDPLVAIPKLASMADGVQWQWR